MKFSRDREVEFAEIERRADAVKRLRAIPNADDVVSISLVAGRVYVVINEITNPGHCTSCGMPRGDRVEVDIDDRDVREALARIFDDRAKELEAIATGTGLVDVDFEPPSPPALPADPFPADIRALYSGAFISAQRDPNRPGAWIVKYETVTGASETRGEEDWLRKNVPADAWDVPF